MQQLEAPGREPNKGGGRDQVEENSSRSVLWAEIEPKDEIHDGETGPNEHQHV